MNYVYFDLESQNLFQDVGGRENIGQLKVACGVTWSTQKNDFSVYWEKDIPALIEELKSATKVIGFNLRGFDYLVLQPYAPEMRFASAQVESYHLRCGFQFFDQSRDILFPIDREIIFLC